jgi:CheY-like chemotaxis protein
MMQALTLAQQAGDVLTVARAYNGFGFLEQDADNTAAACAALHEAAQRFEAISSRLRERSRGGCCATWGASSRMLNRPAKVSRRLRDACMGQAYGEDVAMASVLVIDESDHVCEFARVALMMAGCEVVTTTDSGEGERLIYETTTPFVVLLNLTMPPRGGREILRGLQASPEVCAWHEIIRYSASPHLESVARDCGVDRVLAKPAKGSQIIAAVADAEQALQGRGADA